jgi:hypothetical protein
MGPMTEVPITSYTVIDLQYILLNRPTDDADDGQILKHIARPVTPAKLDKIYMSEINLQKDGAERWNFMNHGSPQRKNTQFTKILFSPTVQVTMVVVSS